MLGLGGYPLVSLAEARNAAFANRQRARAGGDPLAEKRHGQGVPTVEETAAAVLAQQRPGWRNAKYAQDWPRSLRAYAFPRIGAMPVSAVTSGSCRIAHNAAAIGLISVGQVPGVSTTASRAWHRRPPGDNVRPRVRADWAPSEHDRRALGGVRIPVKLNADSAHRERGFRRR